MKEYEQFCGVAKALDIVGERWTLLLVRELIPGGMRYSDLRSGLPGITTNLLAKRLKFLEAQSIIRKRRLAPPSGAVVYELTDIGRELEPVVLALGRFGQRYLDAPKKSEATRLRWLLVSLKRRYRGSLSATRLRLIAEDSEYVIWADGETIEVWDVRGASEPSISPTTQYVLRAKRSELFLDLLAGRRSLDMLVDSGALQIEGHRASLARVLKALVR